MLLDIDKYCKETIIDGDYLPEITSSSIRLSNGTYDPRGLYSLEFFGQERSSKWKNMYAKITIPHPVIHPAIFYIINRRISYLLKWINLEYGMIIKDSIPIMTNQVNSYDYCGISDLYANADIVCTALSKTGKFETISAKTILKHILERKIPIFTSNVIVMPPIFRPNDEDNRFYIKIIEEVNILRSALSSNDKILTNRILSNIQNIYNYLFEDMINKIKGKTGIIRGSMIGKNADFSGRAVIVADPLIKPSQIGIPRTMLIRLFYPWIINYIIHNQDIMDKLRELRVASSIPNLYDLINNDLFEKNIDPKILDILNHVMEIVIKDKVVLSKRDPVLHKLSVRGFYPVPVDDTSIHITPLVCTQFNADFDGDQMSVFVPLTETSQKLVKENMLATKNLYHPLKGLSFTIEKDFVLGIYVMTRDDAKDPNNVEKLADNTDIIDKLFTTEDFSQMIQYKGRTNTLGRRVLELLFNDLIKVNEAIDQKKLASYLEDLVKIKPEILEEVMYRIIRVSATVSTIFGGTMSTKDFAMPEDLNARTKQVVNNPDKYDVDTELDSITKEFIKRTKSSGQLPSLLVTSGARGSAGNIKQISVAKGYVSDTSGKVIPEPIKSNFVEGFKPIDYFISAYGSRKGVVDRVLNTAKSGYLQRQMVYLAASVKSGDTKDCGTDKFFDVLLTEEYVDVLKNRVLRNGEILTKEYIEKNNLIGKVVQIYSPMFCKSKHICRKCFPDTYRKSIDNVKNIGIVSGNIVGERASQLQMRSFHCLNSETGVFLKDSNNQYSFQTLLKLYLDRKDKVYKTLNDMQDEIDVSNENLLVYDGDNNWTKVLKIIRHKRNPDSEMVMVRTKDNKPLILQDNHTILVKKSPIGEYSYTEPKDLEINKHIAKTMDMSMIWQNDHKECFIDPYLLGVFLGNGCVRIAYSNNDYRDSIGPKSYIICQFNTQYDGKIYDKIVERLTIQHGKPPAHKNGDIRMYDTDMAKKLYNNCGRYSYNKHLPPEFIYYDDDTLSKILCGLIDTDGMIVLQKKYNRFHCFKVEICNIGILYQVKMICDKLGIQNYLCLHKPSKKMEDPLQFKHQPYTLQIYPTVTQMEYFKESVKVSLIDTNIYTIPDKRQKRLKNVDSDTINYYKNDLIFNDNDDSDNSGYVYDLMTESHSFMANGIKVHNTGGASKILYVTQEIPQLEGIIRQDNMTLITNKKVRIRVIDYTSETTEEYQSNDFGVTVLEDDKSFDEIVCSFPAIIKFNALMAQNIKEFETDVYLEYEPEDTIGEIIATATDTASAVVMLQSIMNHSNRFESGKDLVIELYETFRVTTQIPLIFLEILVSQLMRDPEKEYYPYRLGSMKEAPKFLGIKTVAAVENPIRGAIFERILDVITNSVIQSNVKDERLSSDLEELFHI